MNTTLLPSVEDAIRFMEGRRNRLLLGAAAICTPYDNPNPYTPFNLDRYAHRQLVGNMHSETWLKVLDQTPADLIPVNPFTPSKFRPHGLAVWDAVVGIKACRSRNAFHTTHTKDTPVVRSGNTYWEKRLIPAINKIGPLGANGVILRPEDPYIVDLTKMGGLGYRMRMAAHAMAHMRGDERDEDKPRKNDKTRLGGFISGITGEMVFAYLYGLPFDTSLRRDGVSADCDFKQYGIEVKSSTQFELPILKVPWMNGEAPRVDATVAMVDIATFIEPHPYGWTSRTMQARPKDYWCCAPTIVMVVGWELVDFITHQPLISSKPGDFDWPVGYGVHPLDMLGPDEFWNYLALARQARGEPVYTEQLRDVEEWLYSKDFDKLINSYPPLPCCIDCMSWNERAEGAPIRPREYRPKPHTNRVLEAQWKRYDADRTAVKKLILPTVKDYEASFYGSPLEANRRRRQQTANYKLVRAQVDERRILKRALFKTREGKDLTREELRVRTEYEIIVQKAKKNIDAQMQ